MSVYGNMIFESYEYNNVIINEFSLSVLKNKFTKNDKVFSKLKTKFKKSMTERKEDYKNSIPNMEIDQLMYYDDPINRLLIIYQESNKILNSVDKELKSILSDPDNINIDKLKETKYKMKSIDLAKVDELLKNKSKESKYHKEKLKSKMFKQTSKIKNLQKNSYNCMKEQKDFISTFVSINTTLLSFIESIDKEKQKDKEIDECIKEIIQISKIQSEYLSKYSYSIKITEKLFKESYLQLRQIEKDKAYSTGKAVGFVAGNGFGYKSGYNDGYGAAQ